MTKALSCILSFITYTLLKSSLIVAQTNVSVGQTLTATTNGSTWISPGGDFAFGFHPFNTRTDLFLLAIWYATIPNDDTLVWHANEGNPVSQGSTVTLDANQGLVLRDSLGVHLWDTSDYVKGVVSHGFMNDTGNFELKGSSGDVVWESFGHPTDTLLPTQALDIGFEVDSRLSETDFTKGRFQLRLIPDGNLVLNTRDLVTGFAYGAYYVSTTNADPAGLKLVYNESGNMYILRKDGSIYDLLLQNKMAGSAKDYYKRATLNFDGVLSWYSIQKKSTDNGWSMIQSIPEDICMVTRNPDPDIDSGICGFNSICSLDDHQRPNCKCPKNYSLIDPNNTYGSCKPDFNLEGCQGYAERVEKGGYQMVHLPNTDWPQNDYERLNPYNEEDCKNSCLNDCFCAAAIFQTVGQLPGCWKKKGPLSNGRQGSKVEGTAWIKVGNVNYSDDPVNPFISPPKKEKLKIVVSVLLGGSVLVNLFILSTVCRKNFLKYHKKPFKLYDEGESMIREYSDVHCFSYRELKDATDGFKEELGRGAFGTVYKGIISTRDSPIVVAVKKLDRISNDADKEFKTEVNVIGRTHHRNLIQLIGFCKEEDQRLLVYEYMSNGTLADYLFGNLRPSWISRVEVALGIARGLLYLHEECNNQIIHCDIKPQNILLDDYHNARISDFGLVKLLVLNQTQTNTAIRGTKGYAAPEWFSNKPVTMKVDVYSFGVVLLEIICCRKNVCIGISGEEKREILTDWGFECYQSNDLDSFVTDDNEALNDRLRLERFVMIALWCIQEDPRFRPTMRMVTHMLQGLAEVPSPPCPTSFISAIMQH